MLLKFDSAFSTGSTVWVIKEIKKGQTKKWKERKSLKCWKEESTRKDSNKKLDSLNVKNSEIFQLLKSEKNTIVNVAKKGWLNNMIWCWEMKILDQTLGKRKRKILLLEDNCSSHKKTLNSKRLNFYSLCPEQHLKIVLNCQSNNVYFSYKSLFTVISDAAV